MPSADVLAVCLWPAPRHTRTLCALTFQLLRLSPRSAPAQLLVGLRLLGYCRFLLARPVEDSVELGPA